MARLYSNENFPLPVVEKLRALGHDVLTIQETGKADQALPDKDVLAAFKKLGLVWNKEGTVNRQFAVFTSVPVVPGCGSCMLRPKCPSAQPD